MHAIQQQESVLLFDLFDFLVSYREAPAVSPFCFCRVECVVSPFCFCRVECVVMRRDHLGYYDALGLEPGAASLPAIKAAFRQAALMWHPDKQKVRLTSDVVVRINKMLLLLKECHEQSFVWYRSVPS